MQSAFICVLLSYARLVATASSSLRARRRRRLEGLIGPIVLGISPAHLSLHVEVTRPPEPSEIARHLQWPLRRRQEVQRERHAATGNTWRVGEAEHLL